jgi:propanol-preferring alcohol dehydrogenase
MRGLTFMSARVVAVARTMSAFQLVDWQQPPAYREVAVPQPGPGEVLVRVGGAGLCHSDLLFLDAPAGRFPYLVPFTLGHENAGWVEDVGAGVEDLEPGAAVLADAHWICGRCEFCHRGYDNYCVAAEGRLQGGGADGGLAEFLVAPRRNLVPLRTLAPPDAAPLADAGRTSYHAVRRALDRLRPGSTSLVIGAGGLGGYAIQWLRALSPARVVVADIAVHRLEAASRLGAHDVVASDEFARENVLGLTDGKGAEAVFDFVGSDATIALALSCARTLGSVALVGAGGGTARIRWGSVPLECDVYIPLGGTLQDLHEVVALVEGGLATSSIETFPFSQVQDAYDRLRRGDLLGRAVVVPD